MKDGTLETFVPLTLRRRGVRRLVQHQAEDRDEIGRAHV